METFSALLALCAGISPHKGQWRGALMFSWSCAWINAWVNNREVGGLRHHRAHYDVNVMQECCARQQQVSRAGTSKYIPVILWDVITCPCPWYLLLAQHSSYWRLERMDPQISHAITTLKRKQTYVHSLWKNTLQHWDGMLMPSHG